MKTNYWWVSEKGKFAIGTRKHIGLGVTWGNSWQHSCVIGLMLPFIVVEWRSGGIVLAE